ncbi:MAG: RNA 2',3'-cyclic phosphodiesterase [Acidobacteriota bacterium]|nr:RNA 2',3'-cyclic phosphodiesterase [Acidobacteriota bacterium]
MRLFTAIPIPTDLSEGLRCFLSRLRPTAKISWSRVEDLHVTTKFIGEWPEPRLEEIKRALASVQPTGSIEIAVKGLGWFPNERRPRVFWAGVDGGEALRNLAQATESAVAELGVPIENRIYSPHLTLARIRETVALDRLREAIRSFPSSCNFDFGSFRATQFFLYLSASGRYEQLAGYPLT